MHNLPAAIPDQHFALIPSLVLDFGWNHPSGFLQSGWDYDEDYVSILLGRGEPGVPRREVCDACERWKDEREGWMIENQIRYAESSDGRRSPERFSPSPIHS